MEGYNCTAPEDLEANSGWITRLGEQGSDGMERVCQVWGAPELISSCIARRSEPQVFPKEELVRFFQWELGIKTREVGKVQFLFSAFRKMFRENDSRVALRGERDIEDLYDMHLENVAERGKGGRRNGGYSTGKFS